MRAYFLLDDKQWLELLNESRYDFYQIPEYLEIEANILKQEKLYFYYENKGSKAIIPLIKRELSTIRNVKYFDLISPYGYPGILINNSFDYKEFNNLNEEFLKKCSENKIVSAFLRLNPFLNNFIFNQSDLIQQLFHGNTVFVDLTQNIENIERDYSQNHKRNIKKLITNGFNVKVNDWDYFKEWQDVYEQTMKRLNAYSYYFYPPEYFGNLKKSLSERLNLITVHDNAGMLCAGGLFTAFNGIIQYHLGGAKEDYLKFAPTKLMFDKVIKWGVSQKMEILHLGGGFGGNSDSLFKFKNGFSKKTINFSTIRYITMPEIYKILCAANFKDQGNPVLENISYFPLYRYRSLPKIEMFS